MSDQVAAEEPKTFTFEDITFDERVTVRQWDAQGKKFLKPYEGVWARRREIDSMGKKGLLFDICGTTKPGADFTKNPGLFTVGARKGSEITDAAGNVYVVLESENDNRLWVKLLKAAPKKQP